MKKIALTFTLSLFTGLYATAAVVYVNVNNTASTQNGQSWTTAYASLQSGIDAANAGDSVWIAAGNYVASTATFAMKADVKVYGGFAGSETQFADRNFSTNIATLTQTHGGPVITCWGNTITNATVIDGLTVTAPATSLGYRAIYNYLSSPTYSNCTIKNSQMGGMNNEHASPMIINCTFLNNSILQGGPGGALLNTYSSATIINCRFIGNNVATISTFGNGGAIYNDNSHITIQNCLFWKNRATGFAGAFNEGGLGGAIFNTFSNPSIINCTFYGNSANKLGTALNNNTGTTAPILRNCIFWGNYKFGNLSGSSSAPIVASYGISLSNSTYNLVQEQPGSAIYHNIDGSVYPQFTDTLNGNFQLEATSPCINAGLNAANTTVTDLAGNARIQNTTIDLGALESSYGTPLPLEIFGFNGKLQENHSVLLQWNFTGTQSSKTAIEVQRSPDGKEETFETLGLVTPAVHKKEYNFIDKEPLTTNFYRLRVRDGQDQQWSRIVMISAAKPEQASRLYPNPAGSKVTLYIAGPALLHTSAFLFSATGTIVRTIDLKNYTQTIDLEAILPGTYFLKLKDNTLLKLVKK